MAIVPSWRKPKEICNAISVFLAKADRGGLGFERAEISGKCGEIGIDVGAIARDVGAIGIDVRAIASDLRANASDFGAIAGDLRALARDFRAIDGNLRALDVEQSSFRSQRATINLVAKFR